ncbi:MAG: ABC transporter ATP-binding protein [Chloroflexota bacterium]|nr:MAG: ABC transporter ATP-binding protein [Chloroflexota bacterium]
MSTVNTEASILPSGAVDVRPTAGSVSVVETNGLTKRYSDHTAVDGLNFRLESGQIFGLLGPNGAGKTTTILMIMGLTEPTDGTVRVLGYDPAREPLKVKRLVGYLPEHVAMYDQLSARENLLYTADLNGLQRKEARTRIDWALDRMGLTAVAEKRAGQFSHGMRQRLGIADVLVKNPKLVVLDEPTLGLDPEAVNHLLDLILELCREEGITVLLCSHQLQQVQRICSRVGILVKGKMIAEGTIDQLAEQLAGGVRTLEVMATPGGGELAKLLRGIEGVVSVDQEEGNWIVRSAGDVRGAIAKAVVQREWSLLHLRERDYGLEEIYLRYFREG